MKKIITGTLNTNYQDKFLPILMSRSSQTTMPDKITLDQLKRQKDRTNRYQVEIQSLDAGWYFVRLHDTHHTVLTLVDEKGEASRFTGTQWVSRALRPLGFTHATLTWLSVADEMVGAPTQTPSPDEMMTYGTRVSFETR